LGTPPPGIEPGSPEGPVLLFDKTLANNWKVLPLLKTGAIPLCDGGI